MFSKAACRTQCIEGYTPSVPEQPLVTCCFLGLPVGPFWLRFQPPKRLHQKGRPCYYFLLGMFFCWSPIRRCSLQTKCNPGIRKPAIPVGSLVSNTGSTLHVIFEFEVSRCTRGFVRTLPRCSARWRKHETRELESKKLRKCNAAVMTPTFWTCRFGFPKTL